MNRFLSGRGGTGGLVREQQRTNELLAELLLELRRNREPERAATGAAPAMR
jgi:hypothetical protein